MKRILITTVYYPPCERIGAKRPFKMANFLSESGWEVTVLTVEPALTPPIGRQEVDIENVEIIRTKAFVPYVALQNKALNSQANYKKDTQNKARASTDGREIENNIKKYMKRLVRITLTSLDQIDIWSGWRKSALNAMKKKDAKYDVVLSTIPPHSTAYLGMELAAYYRCKFVLDYRDPWSEILRSKHSLGECSTRKLKRHIRIEDECLNSCDLVITVSPAITEMLGNRVNKKILTIPQGFTGEVIENSHDKEYIYLFYAGSLAYGRDISRVLSAIKYYAKTYHEKVRLVYCGVHSDLAYEQANAVGATEYIDIRGSMREHEAFEYAKRSLCNLVIVSPDYEYQYPGKVFDLIPAGRPIYVISSCASEAGKLIEKYEIGYSIVGDNTADLARRIRGEIDREFKIPSKVNDLRVDNIYKRMVDEGLKAL